MAPSSSSPSSSSLQAALERFQRERQAFLRALVDLTKPQVFRGFCSRVRHAPLGGPLPSSFDPPLQRAVKRGQPPRLPSHKRTQHADAMLALGCVAVLRGLLQDDVPRCGGGGGCWWRRWRQRRCAAAAPLNTQRTTRVATPPPRSLSIRQTAATALGRVAGLSDELSDELVLSGALPHVVCSFVCVSCVYVRHFRQTLLKNATSQNHKK